MAHSRPRSPRFATAWPCTGVIGSRARSAKLLFSAFAMSATSSIIAHVSQAGGRLLADRALSRLLHKDWPKSIEGLEIGQSYPSRIKS